jgi:uncharacterized membrane protein
VLIDVPFVLQMHIVTNICVKGYFMKQLNWIKKYLDQQVNISLFGLSIILSLFSTSILLLVTSNHPHGILYLLAKLKIFVALSQLILNANTIDLANSIMLFIMAMSLTLTLGITYVIIKDNNRELYLIWSIIAFITTLLLFTGSMNIFYLINTTDLVNSRY